jgi:CelD/BcsL family acetyltransferase involved in cellulose biosynthesis
MELMLRADDDVIAALDDTDFVGQWRTLHAQCPWATGYQHPDYVCAWYRLYRRKYRPLLLWTGGEGKIDGLLALALDADGKALVGAGGPQAAYQVWLALPQVSDAFILAALAQLRRSYPRRHLHLKHLAPGTPVDCLRGADSPVRCTLSAPEPRSYMRTGAERIRKSFNGKTNRNLYNRLKRLGEVSFETITEPAQRIAALDEYILQYDFRQAAMYDCAPFRADPEKRVFYLKLLEAGLLHVSVLKAGDAVVSVNVGLRGPDSVQVGITHSPLYADYSPGRLHTYLLCMELEKEGIACFDLTPGGGYKSLLATDTDEVMELSAFSALQTMRMQRRAQMMKLATGWLGRLGVSTTAARLALARARKAARLAMSGTLPLAMREKFCVYQGVPRAGREMGAAGAAALRANRVDDLLHYDEAGGRKTYHEFQYEAMKRLESRQDVYTITDGGRLVFCAWVGRRGEVGAAAVNEKMPVEPDNAIALYDIYRHTGAGHETGLRGFLEQVLADLHGRFNAATVELVLHAHDRTARSVAEQAGFRLLTQP